MFKVSFTPCSSVSIANFEHVIADWGSIKRITIVKNARISCFFSVVNDLGQKANRFIMEKVCNKCLGLQKNARFLIKDKRDLSSTIKPWTLCTGMVNCSSMLLWANFM